MSPLDTGTQTSLSNGHSLFPVILLSVILVEAIPREVQKGVISTVSTTTPDIAACILQEVEPRISEICLFFY
jgi:hypothetical protein